MKYFKYLIRYIASFFYDIYYFFFGDILSRVQGFNYYKASKKYSDYLKQGNMMHIIAPIAELYCKGRGLDIGAGKWVFRNARAIENNDKENAYLLNEKDEDIDFIFSSHLVEHLENWEKALKEWKRVLKKDGIIFLYLPHHSCKMWEPKINDQHLWVPTYAKLEKHFTQQLNMTVLEGNKSVDGHLSFHMVIKK